MGLRGTGAKKPNRTTQLSRQPAWKRKRGRAERVLAFLESLPITKGILAGTKMKLLPGQRKFVQAIYGRFSADGRRKFALRSRANRVATAKPASLPALLCVICSAPNANHVVRSTQPLITNSRLRLSSPR
jgi:hypothetical protein